MKRESLSNLNIKCECFAFLSYSLISVSITKYQGVYFSIKVFTVIAVVNNLLGIIQPLVNKIKFNTRRIIIYMMFFDILFAFNIYLFVYLGYDIFIFLIINFILFSASSVFGVNLDFIINSKLTLFLEETQYKKYLVKKHTYINLSRTFSLLFSFLLLKVFNCDILFYFSASCILSIQYFSFKLLKNNELTP